MKRIPPFGALDSEIAFVGQSPGKTEGQKGRPFIGRAGQVLRELCVDSGIDPDVCYWTNICDRALFGNDEPTEKDTIEGEKRLRKEIEKLTNLKVIVLVGLFAARLVSDGTMRELSGLEGVVFGHKCIVTYHPSATFYSKDKKQIRNEIKFALKKVKTLSELAVSNLPIIMPEKDNIIIDGEKQRVTVITPTRQSGVAVLLGSKPGAPERIEPEAPTKGGAVTPDWLRILIDETLEKQQPLWEEPRAYFRGSEVGDSCLRSLCLSAMGHRMPIEARLRRIFNTGLAIEASNIGTLLEAGVCPSEMGHTQTPVVYKDPPICGHTDAILLHPETHIIYLGEIKSINENSFKRLPKEHGSILASQSQLLKTHYKYILQWNTYVGAPNLGLSEGFILFESKDKQNQKFYWLLRDEELLEKTLVRLRLAAPYILSDPMRVPPVSLEPDKDDTHKSCPRRYLCTRIPDEGATYDEVRKIDKQVRG